MKLNVKGQVTIPAELRRRHDLRQGDEVEVIDDDGVLRIVRRVTASGEVSVVSRLRGVAGPGPRTDDVLAMTRGE